MSWLKPSVLSKCTGNDTVHEYVTPVTSYRCGGGPKVHTRAFGPAEIQLIRNGLEFDDTELGRGLGSPQLMRWRQTRQFRYIL